MGLLEELEEKIDDFENGFINAGELVDVFKRFEKRINKIQPKAERITKRINEYKLDGR